MSTHTDGPSHSTAPSGGGGGGTSTHDLLGDDECVCVCECVCVWKRERTICWVIMYVCVCANETKREHQKERESLCLCACACVCLCVEGVDARSARWHEFSKVSPLLHLLCQMSMQLTFWEMSSRWWMCVIAFVCVRESERESWCLYLCQGGCLCLCQCGCVCLWRLCTICYAIQVLKNQRTTKSTLPNNNRGDFWKLSPCPTY